MGITSTLMPDENHSAQEALHINAAASPAPEVSDQILKQVVLYSAMLGVPARRDIHAPAVRRGEELFGQLNCVACHAPKLETGAETAFAELSHQTIHPYTDLLLHDLGEGLSDG